MQDKHHRHEKRWKLSVALVLGLIPLLGLGGWSCGDVQPPVNRPKIQIIPKNWVVSRQDQQYIPGANLRVYQEFVIRNQASARDAEDLLIQSIKLVKKTVGTANFKLITNTCPARFASATIQEKEQQGCKPNDCMILGGSQALCLTLPTSLPQEVAITDQGIDFAVEYTPSSETTVPIADLVVVSNTENKEAPDLEFSETRVRLAAQAGSPQIALAFNRGKVIDTKTRKQWGYSFPPSAEGKTVTDTFTVTNPGDATLTYSFDWDSGTANSDDAFHVLDAKGKSVDFPQKFRLEPNQTATFQLTFKAKNCSEHRSFLRIDSNAISKDYGVGQLRSSNTLHIDVRGTSPTTANVSPTSLLFDNVKPGTEVRKTFTVSADSSSLCSLKIRGFSLVGSDANAPEPQDFRWGTMKKEGTSTLPPTTSDPISLKPGESLTVELLYAPKNPGSTSGFVVMDSNDVSLGEQIVSLVGGTARP